MSAAEPVVAWVDSSPRHIAMIREENVQLKAQVRELSKRLALFTGAPTDEDAGCLASRAERIACSALPR